MRHFVIWLCRRRIAPAAAIGCSSVYWAINDLPSGAYTVPLPQNLTRSAEWEKTLASMIYLAGRDAAAQSIGALSVDTVWDSALPKDAHEVLRSLENACNTVLRGYSYRFNITWFADKMSGNGENQQRFLKSLLEDRTADQSARDAIEEKTKQEEVECRKQIDEKIKALKQPAPDSEKRKILAEENEKCRRRIAEFEKEKLDVRTWIRWNRLTILTEQHSGGGMGSEINAYRMCALYSGLLDEDKHGGDPFYQIVTCGVKMTPFSRNDCRKLPLYFLYRRIRARAERADDIHSLWDQSEEVLLDQIRGKLPLCRDEKILAQAFRVWPGVRPHSAKEHLERFLDDNPEYRYAGSMYPKMRELVDARIVEIKNALVHSIDPNDEVVAYINEPSQMEQEIAKKQEKYADKVSAVSCPGSVNPEAPEREMKEFTANAADSMLAYMDAYALSAYYRLLRECMPALREFVEMIRRVNQEFFSFQRDMVKLAEQTLMGGTDDITPPEIITPRHLTEAGYRGYLAKALHLESTTAAADKTGKSYEKLTARYLANADYLTLFYGGHLSAANEGTERVFEYEGKKCHVVLNDIDPGTVDVSCFFTEGYEADTPAPVEEGPREDGEERAKLPAVQITCEVHSNGTVTLKWTWDENLPRKLELWAASESRPEEWRIDKYDKECFGRNMEKTYSYKAAEVLPGRVCFHVRHEDGTILGSCEVEVLHPNLGQYAVTPSSCWDTRLLAAVRGGAPRAFVISYSLPENLSKDHLYVQWKSKDRNYVFYYKYENRMTLYSKDEKDFSLKYR